MSFFSLFKKKKKPSTPPEVAEDALDVNVASPITARKESVVKKLSFFNHKEKKPTTITLVKGSSDSKPAPEDLPSDQQRRHSSSREPRQVINIQHVQLAQTSETRTTSRLYPTLDSVNNERHSSKVHKQPKKVDRKLKSIHDIAGEIICTIRPKLLYADVSKILLDSLKDDVHAEILAVRNRLRGLSSIEYDFSKETYVKEKHSNVENYEKLRSFGDVQKCHKKVNSPINNQDSNNLEVLVFQNYRNRLRCYKGRKEDKIDCD